HRETNAVIEGLLEAGATELLVNDSHWDARNLRIEQLHAGASLINGWQKPFSMVSGINGQLDPPGGKIDAACFIGYHARAGHERGVLSHTYRAQVFLDVKLNGRSVGETGLNAALAGFFDVPVILVSGDDTLCAEASELLPQTVCIEVKKAVSRYSAVLPPFDQTLEKLRKGASQALKQRGQCKPHKAPSPSTMSITMIDPAMADAAELLPGVKRNDARQIELSHTDYSVLFRLMLAIGALGASRKDPHF
ncbi:MAG: M55 family metallopeptidase, partial [Terriglobales bacterium]